jgi:putative hydrolase of HD superfamily
MQASELNGLLAFLRDAEQLKQTHRSAWTSGGQPESVAAHTWRLCLLALALRDELPGVDFERLVSICIVHDLGEAIGGDIPAVKQVPGESKSAQERRDLIQLLGPLPERVRERITALWDEYEKAESAEARLAKALDKLETLIQHNQGSNPSDFDYAFNLGYGREYTADPPLIAAIRSIVDGETARRAAGEPAGSEGA